MIVLHRHVLLPSKLSLCFAPFFSLSVVDDTSVTVVLPHNQKA